jgi:hypothetical protein
MQGIATSTPYHIPAFIPRPQQVPEVRFATNTNHSRGYYRSVMLKFLDGLKLGLSSSAIANNLNALNILSPTGGRWDGERVKATMKRIRHSKRYPTKFYQALLECVFWGEISQADAMPLLLQRTRPGSM